MAKYMVLLHRSINDLNPSIYYTNSEEEAHEVGSGAEYHSYIILTVIKAESYTN